MAICGVGVAVCVGMGVARRGGLCGKLESVWICMGIGVAKYGNKCGKV